MEKRQIAIIPHSGKYYSVRYRERRWLLFWTNWYYLREIDGTIGWYYDKARIYSDQALSNGAILEYSDHTYTTSQNYKAYPKIELDGESE